MTLVSLDLIREKISSTLDEYSSLIQEKNPDVMKEILDVLLLERDILLNEYDHMRYVRNIFQIQPDFQLRIDEMDETTLNNLNYVASTLKRNPGTILNQLMKTQLTKEEFLSEISASDLEELFRFKVPTYHIKHLDKLVINKDDLEQFDGVLKVSHTDYVIVENDVNKELFNEKIKGIYHCKHVEIRSKIPILMIYTKLFNIDAILIS